MTIVTTVDLSPVILRHDRDHAFVEDGQKRKTPRCGMCGGAKWTMPHLGTPRSLNIAGSGGNHFVYQSTKKMWQTRLGDLLTATGLPRGLERVTVEGLICFPDRRRRDQGNFRYLLEKALGDALVAGQWLEDDDWDRYEFGGLRRQYERGESWTELMIFPMRAVAR